MLRNSRVRQFFGNILGRRTYMLSCGTYGCVSKKRKERKSRKERHLNGMMGTMRLGNNYHGVMEFC